MKANSMFMKLFKSIFSKKPTKLQEARCSAALLKVFYISFETIGNELSTREDMLNALKLIMRYSAEAMHENEWLRQSEADSFESDYGGTKTPRVKGKLT